MKSHLPCSGNSSESLTQEDKRTSPIRKRKLILSFDPKNPNDEINQVPFL